MHGQSSSFGQEQCNLHHWPVQAITEFHRSDTVALAGVAIVLPDSLAGPIDCVGKFISPDVVTASCNCGKGSRNFYGRLHRYRSLS